MMMIRPHILATLLHDSLRGLSAVNQLDFWSLSLSRFRTKDQLRQAARSADA